MTEDRSTKLNPFEFDERLIEIILTDDDADDLYLTQEAAKIAGVEAHFRTFMSGEALCDYLELITHNNKEKRDTLYRCIALVDINMPGIGGIKALQRLKSNPLTRHIPVVIYSTSSNQEDVKKAYESGANSYLVKPVEFQGLVEMMKYFNLYWIKLVTLKSF